MGYHQGRCLPRFQLHLLPHRICSWMTEYRDVNPYFRHLIWRTFWLLLPFATVLEHKVNLLQSQDPQEQRPCEFKQVVPLDIPWGLANKRSPNVQALTTHLSLSILLDYGALLFHCPQMPYHPNLSLPLLSPSTRNPNTSKCSAELCKHHKLWL